MKIFPNECWHFEAGGLEYQKEWNPLIIADSTFFPLFLAGIEDDLFGPVQCNIIGVRRVAIVLCVLEN
jgi:hypothetical protein